MNEFHDALLWEGTGEGLVKCQLCPHGCIIKSGGSGICGIRKNLGGSLKAMAYGIYPAVHVDPIEKKPLNHFMPGSSALSIGSVGCNLSCRMCQNWSLARSGVENLRATPLRPTDVLDLARSKGTTSVAFTYNEPTINYEFLMDCAPLLRKNGIRVVLVTNGHLNKFPWSELMRWTDAANIDVKAFTERFYRDIAGGRIEPILHNVRSAYRLGVHIELTYLVIPGHNDDEKEIEAFTNWVAGDMSAEVPVHFTRFHPDHLMMDVPSTPIMTLEKARDTARSSGLTNIYIGNASGRDYNNTLCPSCGAILIRREGYAVDGKGMQDGRCSNCKRDIYGVWF